MRKAGWLLVIALLAGCSKVSPPAPEASDTATTSPEPTVTVSAVPTEPAVPLVQGKFAPKDECGQLAGADAFRSEIRAATTKRDAAALTALAAPDVQLDFGGGSGRDELKSRLSKHPGLWADLAELLPLGCAGRDGGLTLPWMGAQDFGDDTFEIMLATGADVPLLSAAKAGAPAVRRLSWASVKPLSGFDYDKAFRKVRASDGTTGYVETKFLRSPLDYRLVAERRAKGWQITAFIAGD